MKMVDQSVKSWVVNAVPSNTRATTSGGGGGGGSWRIKLSLRRRLIKTEHVFCMHIFCFTNFLPKLEVPLPPPIPPTSFGKLLWILILAGGGGGQGMLYKI